MMLIDDISERCNEVFDKWGAVLIDLRGFNLQMVIVDHNKLEMGGFNGGIVKGMVKGDMGLVNVAMDMGLHVWHRPIIDISMENLLELHKLLVNALAMRSKL
jgi:hypothetical protein